MEQQKTALAPTITYRQYQRDYRRANPDKIVSYRINSAIKLLAKHGFIVTKEGDAKQ